MITNILLGLLLFELFLLLIINWLKNDFQWLITNKDEKIIFNKRDLDKFIIQGYDSHLGWKRKENSSKFEIIKGVGEHVNVSQNSEYNINAYSARLNFEHEKYDTKIITFGDSYSFCRHVNDNQTWQWYLSKSTQTNVENYGVGGYGIDQALQLFNQKCKNLNRETKVSIMMVVPETISRIVNIWKHYNEYGNTFGFKGRYIIDNNKLRWIHNPINNVDKYYKLDDYYHDIQKNDFCYRNKFLKDKICFPYTFSIIKTYKRNVRLIYHLLKRKILQIFKIRNEAEINKAWSHILEHNRRFSNDLYQNASIKNLLKLIILEYKNRALKMNIKPVLVMVPYLQDITKNKIFYKDLLNEISDDLLTIDVNDLFSNKSNNKDFYISEYYGSHLNSKGNYQVAEYLHEILVENHYI